MLHAHSQFPTFFVFDVGLGAPARFLLRHLIHVVATDVECPGPQGAQQLLGVGVWCHRGFAGHRAQRQRLAWQPEPVVCHSHCTGHWLHADAWHRPAGQWKRTQLHGTQELWTLLPPESQCGGVQALDRRGGQDLAWRRSSGDGSFWELGEYALCLRSGLILSWQLTEAGWSRACLRHLHALWHNLAVYNGLSYWNGGHFGFS